MSDDSRFVCTAGPADTSVIRALSTAELHDGPSPARALGAVTATGGVLRLGTDGERAIPRGRRPIMDVIPPAPELSIRLWVIYAQDDDGLVNGAAPLSLDQVRPIVTATVEGMRQDWAGTGIDFVFCPDCDVEIRKDSRLLKDYAYSKEQIAEFPKPVADMTADQVAEMTAAVDNGAYRDSVAAERPGRLMIVLYLPNQIVQEGSGEKVQWVYQPAHGGSFSGGTIDAVFLNQSDFVVDQAHSTHDASRAAHEIGHFLHLAHTHSDRSEAAEPAHADGTAVSDRVKAWQASLAAFIDANVPPNSSPADALAWFDADVPAGVSDTPTDPAAGLIGLCNGSDAGESSSGSIGTVTVMPKHTTGPVVFTPDRSNPMSYYLDGTTDEPMRFSHDQIAVMRGALIKGNRRRLVGAQLGDTATPAFRTAAVWSPSTKGQFFSRGASLEVHRQRHKEHKKQGFHLAWQCAYAHGGEVLFDAIWDVGARPQHVLWGWAESDVKAEVDKQRALGMRVAHLDAYCHPNTDLRYNVVFEPGDQPQSVLLNRSAEEIDSDWNELMPQDNRFRRLDSAVDDQGRVRFAGVMEPGTQVQYYLRDASLEAIADAYDTQWQQHRRLSCLSVALGPAGLSYTGVWNTETDNQLVMWLHFRERILERYDEMWCRGYRLRSLATVAS